MLYGLDKVVKHSQNQADEKKVKPVMEAVLEQLQCPICLDTLKNPFITSCQHNFCHQCLMVCFANSSSIACPFCRNPIQLTDCNKNFLVATILETIQNKSVITPPVKQEASASSSSKKRNKQKSNNTNQPEHPKHKKLEKKSNHQKQLDIPQKYFPLLRRNLFLIKQQGCHFVQFPENSSSTILIIHCSSSQQLSTTEACIMELINTADIEKIIYIAKYKHREIFVEYKQKIEIETGAKIWLPRKDDQSNKVTLKGQRTAVNQAESKLYAVSNQLTKRITIQLMLYDGLTYTLFCSDTTRFCEFYSKIIDKCCVDERYEHCSVFFAETQISAYETQTLEQLNIEEESVIRVEISDIQVSIELVIEKNNSRNTQHVPIRWSIQQLIDSITSCVPKDDTLEELQMNWIAEDASVTSLHKLRQTQTLDLYHFFNGTVISVLHVPNHFHIVLYSDEIADIRVKIWNTASLAAILKYISTMIQFDEQFQQCTLVNANGNKKISLPSVRLAKECVNAEQRYKIEVHEITVKIIFKVEFVDNNSTQTIPIQFSLRSTVQQVKDQLLLQLSNTIENYDTKWKNIHFAKEKSTCNLKDIGMDADSVLKVKIVASKKLTQIELIDLDTRKPTIVTNCDLLVSFPLLAEYILSRIEYNPQTESVIFFSNSVQTTLQTTTAERLGWKECRKNVLHYQIKDILFILNIQFPHSNSSTPLQFPKKFTLQQLYTKLESLTSFLPEIQMIVLQCNDTLIFPTATPSYQVLKTGDVVKIEVRFKYIHIKLSTKGLVRVDVRQSVGSMVTQIQKHYASTTIECKWNQRVLSTNCNESILQFGMQENAEVSVTETAICIVQ